jgi:hypothetical protein
MMQSFAKIGWVGLLAISLCVQMAWAGPLRDCECVQFSGQTGPPSCLGCLSQATSKSGSTRSEASTSSNCCCSRSGLRKASGTAPASSQNGTNSWTHPGCDCELHQSLPFSQGRVPELTLSPSDLQPCMMLSETPCSAWCLRGSLNLRGCRSVGPPRQFSQATLCIWQI